MNGWSGQARSGSEDRLCPPHRQFDTLGRTAVVSMGCSYRIQIGDAMGVPRAPAGPKLELCTTFQRRCEYELLVGDLICINTLIKNHYLFYQEAHSNCPNHVGYAMGVHWG